MQAIDILRPAIVLGVWTFVMAIWMVVTRIPALAKAQVHPQETRVTRKLDDLLPPEVQRVAHNYNHLFEQPTVYYAIVLIIALLGHVDAFHVQSAWAFTILRVLHSCVQATVDIVPARFAIFALTWLILGIMLLREAVAVF